jgi:hypothetical protein
MNLKELSSSELKEAIIILERIIKKAESIYEEVPSYKHKIVVFENELRKRDNEYRLDGIILS